MPLARIQIDAVRCLKDVDIHLHRERNYLFGANAAGKTSVLESVFLLGRGRSFRTRQTARLVKHGSDGLTVYGEATRDLQRHRIGVAFSGNALEIKIDGRSSVGRTQLAGLLPVHILDPKLHELIEAGPSVRRRYLDAGVFHVEHGYLEAWRAYRRVLGQRNAALKARVPDAGLQVWSRSLVETGTAVHAARETYVAELARLVESAGRRLLDRPLSIIYRRGWRQDVSFEQALENSADRDRSAGYTQVGPHRADLAIHLDTAAARDEASRGQQKLAAAAIVLAQVRLISDRKGDGGVLLVDEPAAELDKASLERLMHELGALNAQLLVTGLSERSLRPQSGFPVFHVEQGNVKPVL